MEAKLKRPRPFARLPDTHSKGRATEQLACRWLRRNGFRIVERNWSCSMGELDIVAEEEGTLCFVEVKARRSTRHGRAVGAVGPAKQARLARLASLYLVQNQAWRGPCRFDVLGMELEGAEEWSYHLIRDAFEVS